MEVIITDSANNIPNHQSNIPLCVDLDGTLLKTDSLHESLIVLFKKQPCFFFLIPFWLTRGIAYFKKRVSEKIHLDITSLPVNTPFLEYLVEEKNLGRRLVLATGSDKSVAESAAQHFGLFSDVISSDGKTNLSGKNKSDALIRLFGEKGFDYAGDAAQDITVWQHARKAVIISSDRALIQKTYRSCEVVRVFERKKITTGVLLRAFRLHHWVKNILIFLPLLLAHRITAENVQKTVIAFFSFGFCASAVYILNDLLDLSSDRNHPKKKYRPFASCDLPVLLGFQALPFFLITAIFLATQVSPDFFYILFFYFALTLMYSFFLKKIAMLDVILLALLYVLRIFAGAFAAQTPISHWFMVFAMFFFLSLAFVKRFSDILLLNRLRQCADKNRDYSNEDLINLSSLGAASGYLSVLVFALYVSSGEILALYSRPSFLWLICPLILYWISRVWHLAHRGKLRQDPIVFALRDRVSYGIGVAIAAILLISI